MGNLGSLARDLKTHLKPQTTSSQWPCFTWTIPVTSINIPKSSLKLVCQLIRLKEEPFSFHLMPKIYCFSCKLKFFSQATWATNTKPSKSSLFHHNPVPVSHIQDPGISASHWEFTQSPQGLVEDNGK